MAILNSRNTATVVSLSDLLHIVDVDDPTDNPLGTSKKITINQLTSLVGGGAEVLNDLTDVTTGLPLTPTNADDGRVLYYDVDSSQWISDDIANISNVVKDCKTSVGTGTIPKGTPVYLDGYDNDLLVVEPCDAASAATMPCIGITAEDLDDTNAKKVVSFGKIQGVDTSLYANGTELYISSGGGFTTTRPTGTAEIQRIAVVLKGLDATGGQIKVFNTSRTAGLPNLAQDFVWLGDANGHPTAVNKSTLGANALPDLTDVTLGALSNGEVLTYNSGTGQWENTAPAGGADGNGIYDGSGSLSGATTVTIPSLTSLTFSGTNQAIQINSGGYLISNGGGSQASCFVLGDNAGKNLSTGVNNTIIGTNAGDVLSTGNNSTFIGNEAGTSTTTGTNNTAIGSRALFANTNGQSNTVIGLDALRYVGNTASDDNIAIGRDAGISTNGAGSLTTSGQSIFIGRDTKANANSETNQIVIGHNAIGNGSNTATWGNTFITDHYFNGDTHLEGNLQINTPTPSVVGQVWTATDALGNGSWQAAAGGADTNFATDNLTFTGTRIHTLGSNDLTLSCTGSATAFVLDGSNGRITIDTLANQTTTLSGNWILEGNNATAVEHRVKNTNSGGFTALETRNDLNGVIGFWNYGSTDDISGTWVQNKGVVQSSGNDGMVIADGGGDIYFATSTSFGASGTGVNMNLRNGNLNIGNTTAAGTDRLTVNGTTLLEGNTQIDGDLTVDTNTLFVDASANRVGIGNTSPQQALDVSSYARIGGRIYSNADDMLFLTDASAGLGCKMGRLVVKTTAFSGVNVNPGEGYIEGKFAIGAAPSTYKFEVNGTSHLNGNVLITTASGITNIYREDTTQNLLEFDLNNSASAQKTYGAIGVDVLDSTSGSEDGNIRLWATTNGVTPTVSNYNVGIDGGGLDLKVGVYKANGTSGVSGSFTAQSGETVTVTNGIITGIV